MRRPVCLHRIHTFQGRERSTDVFLPEFEFLILLCTHKFQEIQAERMLTSLNTRNSQTAFRRMEATTAASYQGSFASLDEIEKVSNRIISFGRREWKNRLPVKEHRADVRNAHIRSPHFSRKDTFESTDALPRPSSKHLFSYFFALLAACLGCKPQLHCPDWPANNNA